MNLSFFLSIGRSEVTLFPNKWPLKNAKDLLSGRGATLWGWRKKRVPRAPAYIVFGDPCKKNVWVEFKTIPQLFAQQ